MILTIDFETRSRADIKRVGARAYAMNPSTEVMCLAVKVDDEPPRLWVPSCWINLALQAGIPLTPSGNITHDVMHATTIEAWNAEFEAGIWEFAQSLRCRGYWCNDVHVPDLPLHKLRCSAAKAAMHALPRSLGECGAALGWPDANKDKDGYFAMMRLCKPFKGEFREDPADLIKLFRYCLQDVNAEHAISKRLRDLPPLEQEIWMLDQVINARGVHINIDDAKAVVQMTEQHAENLLKEFTAITKGEISSPAQIAKLLKYVTAANSCLQPMQGMKKADVKWALERGKVTPEIRRLLEIRQSLAKTSVSKFNAFLERAHPVDHRCRSWAMYHGASPGRWTAKGLQLHNMPREGIDDPDTFYKAAAMGPEIVSDLYGDPMYYASRAVRSIITAAPGNELTWADFNAVESRVLNWEAGEEWALQAYREGRDMYKLNATTIFGIEEGKVGKDQRQVGKVAELALGYQGGVVAFKKMSVGYNVVVVNDVVRIGNVRSKNIVGEYCGRAANGFTESPLHNPYRMKSEKDRDHVCQKYVVNWPSLIQQLKALAEFNRLVQIARTNNSVTLLCWCAPQRCHCETIAKEITRIILDEKSANGKIHITESQVVRAKNAWREAHPNVVKFWYGIENAAKAAIRTPGKVYKYGRVAFVVASKFLQLRLSSGRVLYYYDPAIVPKTVQKADGTTWETEGITFMGVDPVIGSPTYGRWARVDTYGGKLVENIVQAVSRDLLAQAMLRIEKAGYPIVLHVHDECVSEHKVEYGSVADYERLMCVVPEWAKGLPIAAEGQRGKRYRK